MGEFNVNKSDGSLEQTAGMPSEYPATQVMMPDGVTNVVDKMGNVRMSKLWENQNPTSSFAAQSITLSSSDYDMLIMLAKYYKNDSGGNCPAGIGKDGYVSMNNYDNGVMALYRRYKVQNDNVTLSIYDCYKNGTADNNYLVPLAIYGIKLI